MDERIRKIAVRRAEWLIHEASQHDATYDQAIQKIMRALSNFVSFGRDYDSGGVRKNNKRVSRRAYDELVDLHYDLKKWHVLTVNEHQKSLYSLWREILICLHDKQPDLTPEKIFEKLKRWPMTTLLKSENATLSTDHSLDPKIRYSQIKFGTLMHSPVELQNMFRANKVMPDGIFTPLP
jgi:hypothetical protein